MRNHLSFRSLYLRSPLLGITLAAVFASYAPALHAQCSDDDALSSLDCQIQNTAVIATQAVEPPAELSIAQSAQKPRGPVGYTEASANGSLSNGATYTEAATKEGSIPGRRRTTVLPPPEPPNEFQRFVATTTGQMLPIYGAGLFASQPALFGSDIHAPAPLDLIVGAEDELQIRVWGQVNFNANLRVSREGEIYLPKAGAVHVAGLPFSEVQNHLRTAMARIYKNFELSVDLGKIHSVQVYVTGQARQTGEYTVSALSTLVDAVFTSGGPASTGSMRHIELRRAGKVLTDFDLYALLVKGDKNGDMQLQPGDVLYIPATGPQVALLGSVRQAGIYELKGEETVAHLLDAAGGRTSMAMGARLSVERIEDHSRRRAFELAGDQEGLSTLLADGDIVRIDPIISSYSETVTLRGSVANPGHFRWHAGMRISDLIPDRDSLVTRGYWWRRTRLGLPAPELISPDQLSLNASADGITDKPAAVSSPGAQTDWNYAVIERLDPVNMTTSLLPFDLGKLVLEHDATQDRQLTAGDVVTIFSQEQVRPSIDRQTKYVQLDGEILHSGIYSASPGEGLRSLIARAGGLTPKAYLYGAEFTRRSTRELEQKRMNEYADRLEHSLERSSIALASAASGGSQGDLQQNPVVSGNRGLVSRIRKFRAAGRIVLSSSPDIMRADELPDLPLEDGDRLVIPSAPATIQVIGAVFNQNAFLYKSSARVCDYLLLAGGASREADRGQEFVLRADGSVISRSRNQPMLASSNFDKMRLYPGDTIVVPEKMVHASTMRELMNWTQLLSQFSLGAAAVNIIK